MSNEEEPQGLVCIRVCDLSKPRTRSVIDYCFRCGVEVWRALSSPKEPKAICMFCIEKDEDVEIFPPTLEQYRDIRDYESRN